MKLGAWIRKTLATEAAPGETIAAAARMGEISRASNILLLVIAAVFVALGVWAALAQVDTVAQAPGKVIPSARVQVLQSLEGGVVQEIHVVQGQAVDAGAVLITLSPMQASGDFQTRQQQALALRARVARLQAEADLRTPEFEASLRRDAAEFVKVESAAFDGRRTEQAAQLAMMQAQVAQRLKEKEEAKIAIQTARRSLTAAREERSMLESLVAQGLEPRIELVRIERVISEAEGREQSAVVAVERLQQAIVETQSRRDTAEAQFRGQARDELTRSIAELRALEQGMPALEDRFDRTILKAPVKGIVNRILVNTVGGVAKPGDVLIELVPADDQLVVEAMVNPRDIGFVQVGQVARVKLTAYDYSIFGAMPGKVAQVGADAITNERGEAFYLVRVETDAKAVESLDRKLPVISGMQAQVDIVTGSKTVLTYLLKPLIAVRDSAFRER